MNNQYTAGIEAQIKQMQKYKEYVQTVSRSGRVPVQNGCYAWCVVNMGDSLVTVNQFPLLPRLAVGLYGASISYFDNFRTYGDGVISINIALGGTLQQCVITQMALI